MIVVTAATGELGRLVVDRLLDRVRPTELAVVVRNPRTAEDLAARGVEVRHGDYTEPAGLPAAFAGADRLLFISSPDLEGRRPVHRSVVAAARDAEVGRIAYTSGVGADMVDEGVLGDHRATEQAILDSGLPYTFLRNPIYTEVFIPPEVLRLAVEAGELTSSTQGRGMNTATRPDLAEATAAALTGPDHSGRAYNLTGPLWTYPELAAVLGDVSGQTVGYREVEEDTGALEWFGPVIRSGGFEVQSPDLETLLGHPARGLRDVVAAALDPAPAG